MSDILSFCANCESINRVDSQQALIKRPTCGKCKTELPMHGLVTEVSAVGFEKILAKADKPVIVDFWASWCGPCRQYGPTFQRTSTKHDEAIFLKIDTEANPQLSSQLGIRGIPTTIVFKNKKEFRRESGALPEEMIAELIR